MEKRVAAPASEEEEERRKRLRALCRNVLQQAGPVEDWSSAKVALFVKTLADNSLLGRGTAELSLADTFRKHGVHGRRLVLLDNFTRATQKEKDKMLMESSKTTSKASVCHISVTFRQVGFARVFLDTTTLTTTPQSCVCR